MHLRATLFLLAFGVADPIQQRDLPRFRTEVDAVTVDVLATRDGRPVAGLSAADFELLDNGVPQRVAFVDVEVTPVDMLLALDVSESVAGERIGALVSAGRAAVQALRPIDRAAVLTFSHEITHQVVLTGDHDQLVDALGRMSAAGNTSLYDAVYAALLLRRLDPSRTLLLIFSDGHDTSSWLQPSDVLQAAARSDAVVYAVTVDRSAVPRPIDALMENPHRKRRIDDLIRQPKADDFLARITESTGGRLLRVEERNLSKSFADIRKEFDSRYLLTYAPRGVESRGWHAITVRVKPRGVHIRARRGYWR